MKTAFGTMVLLPLGFAVAGAYIWATALSEGKLLGMIWTVVGVGLLAFFAILLLVLGSKYARTAAVREHGIATTAVITEMSDTGRQVNFQPRMRIELEARSRCGPVPTLDAQGRSTLDARPVAHGRNHRRVRRCRRPAHDRDGGAITTSRRRLTRQEVAWNKELIAQEAASLRQLERLR